MHEVANEHGRQDFRVDDVIPVSDKALTAEEFEICKNKVGVRSRQNGMLMQMMGKDIFAQDGSGAEANSEMAHALEALDSKLNYLIGVNMLNDASHTDMQDRAVNLSVTGISFVTEKQYKKGDAMLINLMLPSFPPSILELVGRVRRITSIAEGRQKLGVEFYFRCDDEEDSVAKYVYRRHRETIRANNKQHIRPV